MMFVPLALLSICALGSSAPQDSDALQACGDAYYRPSLYTCYDTTFLCPVLNGESLLRCGPDCYKPEMYSCTNDHLVYPPNSSGQGSSSGSNVPSCSKATTLHLSDPPYENYFYSDCNVDAQVVVTSPLPKSNLTIIGPRIVVAWPAGNSGVCAFFAPQNGQNGTLGIELVNSTLGNPVGATYQSPMGGADIPRVGIIAIVRFNSTAVLTVPILGSVRTIRDFTEGPSLLQPQIQDAIKVNTMKGGGVSLTRLWLDNKTTTEMAFTPTGDVDSPKIDNKTVHLAAGDYIFYADFDYPQLTQLSPQQVLKPSAQDLITEEPDQTTSLSFFSYTNKLLAGGWRFLTYFGRDSMIAALLLNPVISEGQGSAVEAVIGAVLERINHTDGSVCHEETIGDYATYLNEQMNITSTAPSYDYKMIDSDLYLPILMQQYFVQSQIGKNRVEDFLGTAAGKINPANRNLTYADLALINAEKTMGIAARFAADGNQTKENLAQLKEGQIVGEWRDSTYGIGGGRIPYDVNTALIPAALRCIAALSRAGLYQTHPNWATLADDYAKIWEDETLQFFAVGIPREEAKKRLGSYAGSAFSGPDQADSVDSDVKFYALSLDGYNNLSQVQVMNTDDCFRHFLLNTTNQTQLTSFVNQTANNLRRTFPAGLLTSVGAVVANPAYGPDPVYAANWTNGAYHGTVVWSWQLAMLARGLELQIDRCNSGSPPDFCADASVADNAKEAYNKLWDSIEANEASLSTEVWSWTYENGFQFSPLGVLPAPGGVGQTESDIRQLWSLTFLAVKRNEALR